MRLKQVLINLLKNAIKFTNDGQVQILMAFDKCKQEIQVQCVDTGKGISEDEMIHLFSMFGKLKRTAAMNNEGIGMGLMICKKLVEGNGGELIVKSRGVNMGSSFIFSMRMSEDKKGFQPTKLDQEKIVVDKKEI